MMAFFNNVLKIMSEFASKQVKIGLSVFLCIPDGPLHGFMAAFQIADALMIAKNIGIVRNGVECLGTRKMFGLE